MKFILYDDGAVLTGPSTYNGMTMTGPLRLNKYPSDDIEAVNKEYVDSMARNLNADSVKTGILPLEVFPDMTGDLTHAAGSGLIDLNNSPVIPDTYPKITVNRGGIVTAGGVLTPGDIPGFSWNKISPASRPTTAAGYGINDAVNRNNGVVVGNVRSPSDPTQPEDLVTKGYADNRISNVSAYSVGDIVSFDTAVTPAGFLRCNGGSVLKTMYPELYSVIGDRFTPNGIYNPGGQNNTNSFNIPDYINEDDVNAVNYIKY